ncbi:MAG: cell division protein FtsQ/DivIB [Candidatus Erginobacter occultus]|nr:cell division protein FtsQ/DivIB [Candidatus Erginobacter occultus]
MKWLTLSSKVSRPTRKLRTRTPSRRRRKNIPAPEPGSGKKPAGGPILVLFLLAALVGGIWWYFSRAEMFVVGKIEVENHHAYTPREVIELAGLETGKNIFSLDPEAAREGIIRNRDFRDAQVWKFFPDVIRIEVMEREPRARVLYGQFYTIDDQGVILGPKKSESRRSLPVIRGLRVVDQSSDLYPPEKRDAVLDLLRELENLEIEILIGIEEISVASSDLIELKTEGKIDITLGAGGYGEQLSRLKTVLENLGPELARARAIDLRYSKVPVKFRD